MKRWGVLLFLLTLALAACAGAEAFPVDIGSLEGGAAYAGYEVVAYDMQGDQIAAQLSGDGKQVLCILEKEAGDAAYAVTVANETALHQDGRVASLLLDTTGDALFWNYTGGEGELTGEVYSSFKADGQWGTVATTLYYEGEAQAYWEWSIFPQDGGIGYTRFVTDGNENVLLTDAPVYAYGWPSEQFLLANFDVDTLPMSIEAARAQGFTPTEADRLLDQEIAFSDGMNLEMVLWGNAAYSDHEYVHISHAQLSWGGIPLQEFPVGLRVSRQVLALEPAYAVTLEDVNFDGYLDLRFLSSEGAMNAYYGYWLWDANLPGFVHSLEFDKLEANPSFDAASKQIN